ncbi:uncharacterized protein MYCFIDRAFT_80131 [Pseudocercospora fijiensis CIRAD86]|uniref:Uncharacterized protein n=1 Tax=Pseudocercospora fijiensis (strain CIRAD86) TaxID=383855 RepID=N1QBY0_PSEFD|nr:uncharacterized protein MYCFIDRAFT_80131 [Pseudocercospora fijiensis CIRAD86]EME88758.1 hypothetical protein MYCFIDRAFT_80131 [Pseudocercospora fijiensis CIRAD86]
MLRIGQYAYGFLTQNFAAMAGTNYLITFNVSMTGPGNGYCTFRGSTNNYDMNNRRFTSYSEILPPTVVYSSGTLRSDVTWFNMLAECPQGPGWTVTLDDIAFYSYKPSPGYDPAPVVPVVIVAGASYSYANSAFQQYNIPTVLEAQSFTLTADLQVALPGGTRCTLQLGFQTNPFSGSDCDTFTSFRGGIFCQTFSTGGSFPINVHSETDYSYNSLDVMLSCYGSSGSTLTINNLYLTVNT